MDIGATIAVGFVGPLLTLARRYSNSRDEEAGYGVAGWIVGIIFLILFG